LRYFQLWNVQLRFIVTFTLAGWFRRCLFSSPTFASGYVFGIVGLSLFFFSLLFLFPFFESFSFELFLFVFSFLFKFFLDFFASICPVKFEQFAYIAFVGVEKAIHSLRVGMHNLNVCSRLETPCLLYLVKDIETLLKFFVELDVVNSLLHPSHAFLQIRFLSVCHFFVVISTSSQLYLEVHLGSFQLVLVFVKF
jgi:hypothetical protein